jgi:hypothetical protein
VNYLLIKTKLNNNGVNMPKPIQFKKLLLLMLLFCSSTNVFSEQIKKDYVKNQWQGSRYTDHKNGTVTDKKTGLMWKQCPEGLSDTRCSSGNSKSEHTFKGAIELAQNTTFPTNGYSDWRLPNIKELASLVAYDRVNPAINSAIFPKTSHPDEILSSYYWSSSPSAFNAFNAWSLVSSIGRESDNLRTNRYYVRLVRDVE